MLIIYAHVSCTCWCPILAAIELTLEFQLIGLAAASWHGTLLKARCECQGGERGGGGGRPGAGKGELDATRKSILAAIAEEQVAEVRQDATRKNADGLFRSKVLETVASCGLWISCSTTSQAATFQIALRRCRWLL